MLSISKSLRGLVVLVSLVKKWVNGESQDANADLWRLSYIVGMPL
jgi:hypothetical protein